jgi:hypothetical protein
MATTMWDKADDFDEARDRDLEFRETPQFWKELIEGNYSVNAPTVDKTPANRGRSCYCLRPKRLTLKIQRQMIVQMLPIHQTDAGKVLQDFWVQEKNDISKELEYENRSRGSDGQANKEATRESPKIFP